MNARSVSIKNIGLSCLLATAGIVSTTSTQAQINFSEDFNSYANDSRLDGSVWNWAVETFTPSHDYVGGYYPGTGNPSGLVNINAILNTVPGDNNSNVLKYYGDYGYSPNFENDKIVRTSAYIQQTLTLADVTPGTVRLQFDSYGWSTAEGGLDGVSTASGWIKLLATDYSATYFQSYFPIGQTPAHGSVDIQFDGTQAGLHLQYGFYVESQNYSPTAIAIDNIQIHAVPEPSTYGLIGAGLTGAFVMFARRRRQA